MDDSKIETRIRSSTVTVAATATKIPTNILPTRKAITMKNVGAATVYLGHSGVTTANGLPLGAGESVSWNIGEFVDIYGITATGTIELRILEAT